MASKTEWGKLLKETFLGMDEDGVLDLYRVDIRGAAREFLLDSRETVEAEKNPFRRKLKIANAVLFGMAKRLPAPRRLVFLGALVLVVLAGLSPPHEDPRGDGVTGLFSFYTLIALVLVMAGLLALELVDKLRFRGELEMARDLQADLVQKDPPEVAGFELGAFNQIANTVGGDLYEFAPLPDGRLAVLFGDASGHGMAAGLVMAVVNASFRTQLEHDPSPEAVIGVLNKVLCRSGACRTGGPRSFFSGVVFLIEPNGDFRAVVAGHPPILRLSPAGAVLQRVGQGSYPLGIRDKGNWIEERGSLAPRETLVFVSDGLPEARSLAGEDYGYERLEALLTANAGAAPQTIVNLLTSELRSFLGGRVPEDDVSIAVIRKT